MRRNALPTLVLFTTSWIWFSVMAALNAPGADPAAMTVGCTEASCCTSRCYLDEHGTHHCVPRTNASCSCGLSSQERDSGALPVLEAGTLPMPIQLQTDPSPAEKVCTDPVPLHRVDLVIPTPPPRSGLPA